MCCMCVDFWYEFVIIIFKVFFYVGFSNKIDVKEEGTIQAMLAEIGFDEILLKCL